MVVVKYVWHEHGEEKYESIMRPFPPQIGSNVIFDHHGRSINGHVKDVCDFIPNNEYIAHIEKGWQ